MSKKLNNLKWESVAFDGFPVSAADNLQGFVALEECSNYGLDNDSKKSKKKKQQKKRKNSSTENQIEVPNKKVKLSNGFVVESCNTVAPSQTNEERKTHDKKSKRKDKKTKKHDPQPKDTPKSNKNNKKAKPRLGENTSENVSQLTPEDMLTWAEFKLPDPIMKALTELGFQKPTKIQELTLPAAIHGRRDILGAAETGSGKTLAFGLPILTGIMEMKAKADAGFDVYEIKYKKRSTKKKEGENKPAKKRVTKKKRLLEKELKESSEDGYGSDENNDKDSADIGGDDNSDNDSQEDDDDDSVNDSQEIDEDDDSDNDSQEDNDDSDDGKVDDTNKNGSNEEYLEEIEVPIKRKKEVADDENESDDSDNNYIHLSDMLDSDDLGDSSDEENDITDQMVNGNSDSNEEDEEEEGFGSDDNNESGDDLDGHDEVDADNPGIGCVKVIDDVELPEHIAPKTGKPLYALILTPTRELAMQISRHLIAVAKYTGIRVATIVGGMASVKQERQLKCGPEIVVATPGRLWELINAGTPHLSQLASLKFLAIDETDRMVERGHFEELTPLLERINSDEARSGARQNFVFSATLTMVHELPSHMKGKKVTKRGKIINRKIEKMTPQQKINRLVKLIGMTEPKVVDITTKNLGTAETLTESRITCALEHKDAYVYYIVKRHPGRTIVFCNSINSLKRLADILTLLQCRPLPLHAGMQQRQRLKNLERFRDDPQGLLIATDVAARGLDIPDIDHVVHYQVPRTAENYVHRSGRTARANKEGLTILIMDPSEAFLYSKLCRTLNKTSELPSFPVPPPALCPLRSLVSAARELQALEAARRRAAQALGWRERAAKEMDIIIDDDHVPVKQIDPTLNKAIASKKRELASMMSRPLFPRGFSFKFPTLNEDNVAQLPQENALQVMKNSIESGQMKKEKRKGKNEQLLKLAKNLKKKK